MDKCKMFMGHIHTVENDINIFSQYHIVKDIKIEAMSDGSSRVVACIMYEDRVKEK